MEITATITGDLRAMLAEETVLAAAAVRRGVQRAGEAVRDQLRDQVRSSGIANADKLANVWRMKMYPAGETFDLQQTAFIYVPSKGRSNAVNIINAMEQGQTIRAAGGKYLAWPTPYNAKQGRRGGSAGVRITLADMIADRKGVVVIPTKKLGLKLWCARVRVAQGLTRTGRKGRLRLFVGGKNVEIVTGRIKVSARNKQIEALLQRGYVAMFFLAKQVPSRKLLDVEGVFNAAGDVLEAAVRRELA